MKGFTYILKGKIPQPCDDVKEWSNWFETANRIVAETSLNDVTVSTVFLGTDMAFILDKKPPALFETMVFGGKADGYIKRYATWEEAEQGHNEMVRAVKENTIVS